MPWTAIAIFVGVAYVLGWAVITPLWLSGGLTNPLLAPLGFVLMATPAVGALVATLLVLRPQHPGRFLGLVPLRPTKRLLGYCLLGFALPQLLGGLAIVTAGALGVARITTTPQTLGTLALVPLLSLATAVPALAEELGWRGFLLPALRPLGNGPALLIMGVCGACGMRRSSCWGTTTGSRTLSASRSCASPPSWPARCSAGCGCVRPRSIPPPSPTAP